MVEALVVLGVFSLLAVAILSSVQTGYITKRKFDEQSTVENLIRNQMELVFQEEYATPPASYTSYNPPPQDEVPAGYSVKADALVCDASTSPLCDGTNPDIEIADIEIVRITVLRGDQTRRIVDTLRANR